jgi:hypothetical protein
MDRRQVIAGASAVALAAAIPVVAVVAQAADPAVDRMKALLHQLFGLLRSDGFAVAKLQDGSWLWPPDALLLRPHPSTPQGRPLESGDAEARALARDAGEGEEEASHRGARRPGRFVPRPYLAAPCAWCGGVRGGQRRQGHPKVAKQMKDEGVTPGVPDIFAIDRRQVYFLEMKKAKGGQVSKAQKDMMARLTAAGAICAVANGLAEAIQQLEAWGLLVVAVATAEQEEMAA